MARQSRCSRSREPAHRVRWPRDLASLPHNANVKKHDPDQRRPVGEARIRDPPSRAPELSATQLPRNRRSGRVARAGGGEMSAAICRHSSELPRFDIVQGPIHLICVKCGVAGTRLIKQQSCRWLSMTKSKTYCTTE